MPTTVWIDRDTHARLTAFKQQSGASSLAAAIRTLLDAPQESASTIYSRRRAQVEEVCRRHGVIRLVAFGSRARGDATAGSDLDIAVELPRGIGLGIVTVFSELKQALAYPADIIEYPEPSSRMYGTVTRDEVELYAR